MKLRSIVFGFLLALASPLAAFAQCSGQAPAQTYCGNNTGSLALPGWKLTSGITPTAAAMTKSDDTNVTLTLTGTPATSLLQAVQIAAGWSGQLSMARGGTNASLVASLGGIFYSTASAGAVLSGTATARQMLQSGASAAPAWSTAIWPATTTINQLLYSSSANVVAGLPTANSSVLVTDSGGIPSFSTTLPIAVGRERLAADRAYYVRTSGSDTNCSGLVNVDDPGSGTLPRACAFSTPQKPVTVALTTLDFNGKTVTSDMTGAFTSGITCAGTFVGAGNSTLLSSGSFVLASTAGASITTTSANAIAASQGCNTTITGANLTLSTVTTGISLIAYNGGDITFGGVIFGAAATGHIQAGWNATGSGGALLAGGGKISGTGSYSITGSAPFHLHAVTEGSLIKLGETITVTLTGTPAFSNWYKGATKGLIYDQGVTYSGSATGSRYLIHNGAVNCCESSRTNTPGNAAGIVAAGGSFVVSDADADLGVNNLVGTNRAALGTPASGYTNGWFDTTDKRFHDKNDAGTIGTTVVADTGASNNFLTAISAAGVISKAQPTIGNLASIATNTVVGNATSGSAAPTALAVGTCSTAASALIWTTNTGFGCNTSITANTATTATNATNIGITDDTTTNATMYPVWVTANTGNLPAKVTSTKMDFNPSTGTLQATKLVAANGTTGGFVIKSAGGAQDAAFFEGPAGALVFAMGTANLWSLATNALVNIIDYASTTASTVTISAATTITNATVKMSALANTSTTSAVCYNTGTGLLTYNGTVGTCTVSDERLKNMGERIPNALDRLLKINGVYYTWKDPKAYGGGRQIGVGAQTVERVFPELVQVDSQGHKSADYQRLTAPIIEALREIKADNDNLRMEISALKKIVGRP